MRIHSVTNLALNNKTIQKSYGTHPGTNKPIQPVFGTKISFKGADVNKNQILLLAAECTPYSVSGGLGAVIRDMSKAFKEQYPNKDIRIMVPFYNVRLSNGKPEPVYVISGVKNQNGSDFAKFDLEDTGIETDFHYGIRKSSAKLYKAKKPENGVTTYFLYCPELEDVKKEYCLDDYSMFERYCAFSNAAVALREKMKNSGENFNPAILHTNDWHTAFAAISLKNSESDVKSVHGLLNAHAHFQGRYMPFAAALNSFSEAQLDRLMENKDFKREMMNLIFDNKYILLNEKTKNLSDTRDLNKNLNNKEFMRAVLVNVADNYQTLFNDTKNSLTYSCINNIIRNEFNDVCWDENNNFNATVNALKNADAWFTISKTHLNELLTQPEFSSLSLYNMMRVKLPRGTSILNKIDVKRYDPENPEQVYKTYNVSDFENGKSINKDFLFRQFSRENILTNKFNSKLINNPENAYIYGSLDSRYKSYPLAMNISRFDTNQKGSDIALKTAEILLKQNQKINFVFALPGIKSLNPQVLKDFETNVIKKYPGRVVLIDAYVPINEYAAASDFSIIPSRSETCGLVGYQSMRMGAVPISAPIGSMNDCLITPYHDIKNAMGFKAPLHFLNCTNPPKVLANTINTAIDFYYDEPSQFKRMIKNCMMYDSSWKPAVVEQNALYERILNNQQVGNLSVNDLKEVTDRHNLKILRKNDIDNLEKADVLVLLAHPDDEIFFLPVLKAIEDGKSVQIVYGALGEKGHRKDGAPNTKDELVKHREYELLDALNELGITRNPVVLDIPDLEFYKDKYTQDIFSAYKKIIKKVQPKEVWSFGPDGFTGNGDHKLTGKLALDCVNLYNKEFSENVKIYQPALTAEDAKRLKDYASYTSDAFDFVKSSDYPNTDMFTMNVSKYRNKFENSLIKYRSQWSKNEVKAITDFYNNAPVHYVSKTEFPKIDAEMNPWAYRNELFSRIYGKDFEEFNGGISFKPFDLNYKVNLYLGDFNTNRKRLWIETSGLKDYELAPELLASILKNSKRITYIPKFKDVKYFDIVLYRKENRNARVKITVPVDETVMVLPYVQKMIDDPVAATVQIIKENPYTGVNWRPI